MSVAVVITCHNYGRYLDDCIKSVLGQTTYPNEIIVVLDNCSDNSYEVASKYPVKIITTDGCNEFLSRRIGLSYINSDVVIFLDADDMLGENYIKVGLESFAENIGVVTGVQRTFGDSDHIWPPGKKGQNVATSAALVKTNLVRDYFNKIEFSFSKHPDWECWKHVMKKGKEVRLVGIEHLYRQHGKNMSLGGGLSKDIRVGVLSSYLSKIGGVETLIRSKIKHSKRLLWTGVHSTNGTDFSCAAPNVPFEGLDCDIVYATAPSVEHLKRLKERGIKIILGVHTKYNNNPETFYLSDLIWCVSQEMANCINTENRHKVRVIRPGVELSNLYPVPNKNKIREQLYINSYDFVVGYVGRLSKEKGLDKLVDTISEINECKLLVYTERNQNKSIVNYIDEKMGAKVYWVHPDEEPLRNIYSALDCLIITSPNEGAPTVTMEALASGTPVLTTNVGFIKELSGYYGTMAYTHNFTDIEQKVKLMWTPYVKEITRRGKEVIINNYNSVKMTRDFEKLCLELMQY